MFFGEKRGDADGAGVVVCMFALFLKFRNECVCSMLKVCDYLFECVVIKYEARVAQW
jgi:hypothetical protein